MGEFNNTDSLTKSVLVHTDKRIMMGMGFWRFHKHTPFKADCAHTIFPLGCNENVLQGTHIYIHTTPIFCCKLCLLEMKWNVEGVPTFIWVIYTRSILYYTKETIKIHNLQSVMNECWVCPPRCQGPWHARNTFRCVCSFTLNDYVVKWRESWRVKTHTKHPKP